MTRPLELAATPKAAPDTAPCPRCGRDCERVDHPSSVPRFACDNCERGDSTDGSRAMGPLVFTADECAVEQAIDWSAVAAEVEGDLARLKAELQEKRQEVLALDRHIGNGETALRYALRMAAEQDAEAGAAQAEGREP